MKLFVIVLTLASRVLPSFQTNYCDPNLCAKGGKHIACNNNGSFASICNGKNAHLIQIKPHIAYILDEHNKKRNTLAGGQLEGYMSAKRMATMKWDEELAKLAEFNVKKCDMILDACRRTDTFEYPGQNLGIFGHNGAESSYSDKWLIKNRINGWWSEYQDCNMEYIDKYPSQYRGPAIGHFTTMAKDYNNAVGCAATRWKHNKFYRFLMTCNYAQTNWRGHPTFEPGQTAADCHTGKNDKYENLCSPNENYFN